jgi:hypothetical protein
MFGKRIDCDLSAPSSCFKVENSPKDDGSDIEILSMYQALEIVEKKKMHPKKMARSSNEITQLNSEMRRIEIGNYSLKSMIAPNYSKISSHSVNNDLKVQN